MVSFSTIRAGPATFLLAQSEHMGVKPLLDEYFPIHGNWEGLSLRGHVQKCECDPYFRGSREE
jgi:hypothetical protein